MSEQKRTPPLRVKIYLCVIFGGGFLGFLALAVHMYAALYEAYNARSWPMAQGKVIHSQVLYLGGGKGCHYDVDFRYDYAVGGQSYSGTNFMFGGGPCNSRPAHEIVDGHPAGAKITVHYAPDDPSRSVIEPGQLSANDWLGVYFMPVVLVMFLWLLLRLRRGQIKLRQ